MNDRERLIELMTKAENENLSLLESEKKILADYLLANGVVVLPCKIGDTVYIIPMYNGKPYCGIRTDKIQMIGITSRGWHIKPRYKSNFNKTYMIGKTAFLTKEEAEQALKGGNEK